VARCDVDRRIHIVEVVTVQDALQAGVDAGRLAQVQRLQGLLMGTFAPYPVMDLAAAVQAQIDMVHAAANFVQVLLEQPAVGAQVGLKPLVF